MTRPDQRPAAEPPLADHRGGDEAGSEAEPSRAAAAGVAVVFTVWYRSERRRR
jgi:hypothetical protein